MPHTHVLPALRGAKIHLVGAKGTGMAALAEILKAQGAILSGSDVADVFYTDAILAGLGVDMRVGFSASNLPDKLDLVIHSAAYAPDRNPELLEATRRSIPVMNYPEALGALSAKYDSSGIAGVHGKTTTTAMAGCLIAGLGLPATILAGSAVAGFGGRSTKILGEDFFVAETCEYRRHFLNFHPRRIVLTSVESDHQDYYPRYEDILAAFIEYGLLLPHGGKLIYCADDAGACEAAAAIASRRPDIRLVPYGLGATGPFKVEYYRAGDGKAAFKLAGFGGEFALKVPGEHLALDATAAIALSCSLLAASRSASAASCPENAAAGDDRLSGRMAGLLPGDEARLREALLAFSGSKRRSEFLGEAGGVIFMDDYGHHPTAIRDTIQGIKAFWPGRRLVVDFMSHTYSRTKALFDEFSACLDEADIVILHRIYASARETPDPSLDGRRLFDAVAAHRAAGGSPPGTAFYFEDPDEAREPVLGLLREGDLFLTMGAGDNWKLGAWLLERERKGDGGKA
jgi:UDP-N-acetylmuramate--alanine ligase